MWKQAPEQACVERRRTSARSTKAPTSSRCPALAECQRSPKPDSRWKKYSNPCRHVEAPLPPHFNVEPGQTWAWLLQGFDYFFHSPDLSPGSEQHCSRGEGGGQGPQGFEYFFHLRSPWWARLWTLNDCGWLMQNTGWGARAYWGKRPGQVIIFKIASLQGQVPGTRWRQHTGRAPPLEALCPGPHTFRDKLLELGGGNTHGGIRGVHCSGGATNLQGYAP